MKMIVSAHQLQSSRCTHERKKSKEETATTFRGREDGEQLWADVPLGNRCLRLSSAFCTSIFTRHLTKTVSSVKTEHEKYFFFKLCLVKREANKSKSKYIWSKNPMSESVPQVSHIKCTAPWINFSAWIILEKNSKTTPRAKGHPLRPRVYFALRSETPRR